jgi:ribosomal protein S18 acetylase RimI-like enzyme
VPVEVRRATPADWPRLKALRLEALADTPIGFLETLEQAEQLDDGVWQARAARGAEGGDSLQVVAWDGARPVGTCVSFVGDGRAWLVAVYVSPTARGRGLLGELVQRCADWARERGQPELVLEVHEDNARARAAYDKVGFVETGASRPYPLNPSRSELEMVLPLR